MSNNAKIIKVSILGNFFLVKNLFYKKKILFSHAEAQRTRRPFALSVSCEEREGKRKDISELP